MEVGLAVRAAAPLRHRADRTVGDPGAALLHAPGLHVDGPIGRAGLVVAVAERFGAADRRHVRQWRPVLDQAHVFDQQGAGRAHAGGIGSGLEAGANGAGSGRLAFRPHEVERHPAIGAEHAIAPASRRGSCRGNGAVCIERKIDLQRRDRARYGGGKEIERLCGREGLDRDDGLDADQITGNEGLGDVGKRTGVRIGIGAEVDRHPETGCAVDRGIGVRACIADSRGRRLAEVKRIGGARIAAGVERRADIAGGRAEIDAHDVARGIVVDDLLIIERRELPVPLRIAERTARRAAIARGLDDAGVAIVDHQRAADGGGGCLREGRVFGGQIRLRRRVCESRFRPHRLQLRGQRVFADVNLHGTRADIYRDLAHRVMLPRRLIVPPHSRSSTPPLGLKRKSTANCTTPASSTSCGKAAVTAADSEQVKVL